MFKQTSYSTLIHKFIFIYYIKEFLGVMSIDIKSVYILSAEAKDLYNSNHLRIPDLNGYGIRNKGGEIAKKRFTNALDFSLDLMKIREVYEKVYRRNNFTFSINKKDYTQHVICVKFTYSHKLYNKAGRDIYIKEGYQYKDLKFQDNVCIVNGELIGIIVNSLVESPISNEVLGDYFDFEEGKYIKNKKQFPTIKTKRELREELYENGFICDGIKYVRYKRSSGSSRVGKCLFINEKLYSRLHKWDLCGLKVKKGDEIDLAGFESYISLPSSSIIDIISLEPKNFLVVDDYESVFNDEVVGVDYKDGQLISDIGVHKVKNSLFDGQSLMDVSLFKGYPDKGMLLLRNRFFKSACFNTNIQQWFHDHEITSVSQLNGMTLAENISDIKIITTPSSIKYVKFAPIKQWLDNLDPIFGIVKFEKPTHYFDGRMVQCHYQLLNSLQLDQNQVHDLIEPTLEYISMIRDDPDVLRYHINYPYETMSITPLNSKNEIVFKLLGINNNFCKTKMYYDFRDDLIRSMLRNLKQGHILINGNYSTLLGNGVEMLQHSIGEFKGESVIGIGNIYSKRFEEGKIILGSRSPHINSGNIFLAKNVGNEYIERYFNLSKEIVYVNAINENIQQRLNGCDRFGRLVQ